MTTNSATTIQEIHGAAGIAALRRRSRTEAVRGIGALSRVCRGLFGGWAGKRAQTADRTLDDTVEIVISRPGRSPLASAA